MKYPRTYHIPSSPGTTNDDKKLNNLDHFKGKNVVVSLKMDGENTSMYFDRVHARSEDSNDHPSRHWIKNLHNSIKYLIPDDIILCGENLYAKHSIHYTNLKSYFYLFSTWHEKTEYCMAWQHTKALAIKLDLTTVPILYKGLFDYNIIKDLENMITYENDKVEGFVIRLEEGFYKKDFSKSVAKYVRANHVQTDKHWMYQKVIKNMLNNG
jgi:hypothetical protein